MRLGADFSFLSQSIPLSEDEPLLNFEIKFLLAYRPDKEGAKALIFRFIKN